MCKVKVSVIMSAYNESKDWLSKAIESILNQSFKDFEFIIILDNPKNKQLEELIIEYKNKDSRISYEKNQENIGLVKSLNKGLKLASGKYIARMDADDIALCDRLRVQYEFMEKNQHVGLIGSSVALIDEMDNVITEKTATAVNPIGIQKYLKHTNVVVHPTYFFRKQLLNEGVNEYRNVHFAEDYDFVCRVAATGHSISNIDIPLLQYRIRQNSVSREKTLEQIYNAFYVKQLYKQKRKAGVDSYKENDLYSQGKIPEREISRFKHSENLKEAAKKEKAKGNILKSKLIFLYSKLVSYYARKNAYSTLAYKVLLKIYG